MFSLLTSLDAAARAAVAVAAIALGVIVVAALAAVGLILVPVALGAAARDWVLLLWRSRRRKVTPAWVEAENNKLAKKFSVPGTVKNFALRLGFLPHDEEDAEALLRAVIEESEMWHSRYRLLRDHGIDRG